MYKWTIHNKHVGPEGKRYPIAWWFIPIWNFKSSSKLFFWHLKTIPATTLNFSLSSMNNLYFDKVNWIWFVNHSMKPRKTWKFEFPDTKPCIHSDDKLRLDPKSKWDDFLWWLKLTFSNSFTPIGWLCRIRILHRDQPFLFHRSRAKTLRKVCHRFFATRPTRARHNFDRSIGRNANQIRQRVYYRMRRSLIELANFNHARPTSAGDRIQ